MRTPPEILKSVVFLGHRQDDVLKLGGTAFIASIPEGKSVCHYLVTSRHSILALKGKDQVIRANTTDGGAIPIQMDDNWWFHPTEEKTVDVAVRPFDPKGLDTVSVSEELFLTEDKISEFYIGQGDEVSITGLFTKVTGESTNVPILRRGCIAMFPDDKIQRVAMGDGERDIDGYLIEVRSVGGMSGSPVFVRAPIGLNFEVHTRSGKRRVAKAHFQGDYFLLGVAQSHWEIPPDQKNKIDFQSANKREESINLGIAIVVPAKKILEVLNHQELVAMRKQREKERKDSAGSTEPDYHADDEPQLTQAEFEAALKKSSRKVVPPSSQSDQEKA
jgi:hypothetical protein